MGSTMASQVQWLVDRSMISDLLYSFARALDTKDFTTYVGNYAASTYKRTRVRRRGAMSTHG